MGSVKQSLAMDTMENVRQSPGMDIMVTIESVRQSPAMDIMATMGRDLLSLAMATMESVRQSPAMDIMAMVTMERGKLSQVSAIMAMDFHTMEAMWCMDKSKWRLALKGFSGYRMIE